MPNIPSIAHLVRDRNNIHFVTFASGNLQLNKEIEAPDGMPVPLRYIEGCYSVAEYNALMV